MDAVPSTHCIHGASTDNDVHILRKFRPKQRSQHKRKVSHACSFHEYPCERQGHCMLSAGWVSYHLWELVQNLHSASCNLVHIKVSNTDRILVYSPQVLLENEWTLLSLRATYEPHFSSSSSSFAEHRALLGPPEPSQLGPLTGS